MSDTDADADERGERVERAREVLGTPGSAYAIAAMQAKRNRGRLI